MFIEYLAQNEFTNKDILFKIASRYSYFSDIKIKKCLARNKSICIKSQQYLVTSLRHSDWKYYIDYVYMYKSLALNPSIDKSIQLILFKTKHSTIHQALAGNPSIDKEIQLMLVSESDLWAKAYLIHNPSLDSEVNSVLLKDKNSYIKTHLKLRNTSKL